MEKVESEKPTLSVDMNIIEPLLKEMEMEFTQLLEKYYNKSPYKKWELYFKIRSYAYDVHVDISTNPDYEVRLERKSYPGHD